MSERRSGVVPKRIIYYVSGHGFGHARRAAAIMQAIVGIEPQAEIIVRTTAPAEIFAGMPRVRVDRPAIMLDFGAAERDAMTINVEATLRGAAALDHSADVILQEIPHLSRAEMVVADIPFVVGKAVAEFRQEAGPLPAIAVGNFTWDWIYEPYFKASPEYADLGRAIRAAYAEFDAYLRLPLSHETSLFRRVVDVPLVIHEPQTPAAETLRHLGVDGDTRPRVLMAMRGGMSADVMRAATQESPHCLFLALGEIPPGMPENLRAVPAGIDFTDLMAACDVAVSKLGYGILADAVACGTRLVWPARKNFREDDIFRPLLPRYVREQEIWRDDLRAGRWRASLDAVMQRPAPTGHIEMNGAEVCARHILGAMG